MWLYYGYLTTIACTLACALIRYRSVETAGKVFTCYLGISFLNEMTALLTAMLYHNNISVYSAYSIADFVVVSLYFNYAIPSFRKLHTGYYIAAAGALIGTLCVTFVQKIDTFNTYFLVFEGISVIAIGLRHYLSLLRNEIALPIVYDFRFWLTTILLTFWSISLLYWSVYSYLESVESSFLNMAGMLFIIFNILIYICFATVFVLIPFLQKKYGA